MSPPHSPRTGSDKLSNLALYITLPSTQRAVLTEPLVTMEDVIMADMSVTDEMSPPEKVFAIAELANKILLDLPIGQLLQLQRVNRHFRDMIASSDVLQRALFFRQSDSDAASKDEPVLNPLFVRYRDDPRRLIFKPLPTIHEYYCILRPYSEKARYDSPEVVNYASNPDTSMREGDNGKWHLFLDLRVSSDQVRTSKALTRGSWRNMYLVCLLNR